MSDFRPNGRDHTIASALVLALAAVILACSGGDKPTPETTVTPQVTEPSPTSTEPPSAEMTVTREVTVAGGTVALGDDVTIDVPPDALAADTTVTITRASPSLPAPAAPELATSIGSAFAIDLGGQDLARPVVLEITFDPTRLPADTPDYAIFAAYYAEAEGVWVPIGGEVDRKRNLIVVETEHLSWWQPWTWDVSEVEARIQRVVTGVLSVAGLPSAEIPSCGAAPAYMSMDFNDLLLVCIEASDTRGRAILKLVNNRAFAVLVETPLGVETRPIALDSLYDLLWGGLVDVVGGNLVYLPPAGEAEFLLRFEGPGAIRLTSTPSDLTLGVEVLIQALMTLGPDAGALLATTDCLISTASSGTQVDIESLVDVLRRCGTVIVPGVGLVAGFFEHEIASMQLLFEQARGGGQGEVVVAYRPPTPSPTPTPAPANRVPVIDPAIAEASPVSVEFETQDGKIVAFEYKFEAIVTDLDGDALTCDWTIAPNPPGVSISGGCGGATFRIELPSAFTSEQPLRSITITARDGRGGSASYRWGPEIFQKFK